MLIGKRSLTTLRLKNKSSRDSSAPTAEQLVDLKSTFVDHVMCTCIT